MLQWQGWAVKTQNSWPPKPKILTVWPFTEEACPRLIYNLAGSLPCPGTYTKPLSYTIYLILVITSQYRSYYNFPHTDEKGWGQQRLTNLSQLPPQWGRIQMQVLWEQSPFPEAAAAALFHRTLITTGPYKLHRIQWITGEVREGREWGLAHLLHQLRPERIRLRVIKSTSNLNATYVSYRQLSGIAHPTELAAEGKQAWKTKRRGRARQREKTTKGRRRGSASKSKPSSPSPIWSPSSLCALLGFLLYKVPRMRKSAPSLSLLKKIKIGAPG